MRRLLLTVVVLLMLPVPSRAQQPEPVQADPLVGVYICEGTNPDGNPYRGIVQIVPLGKLYGLHWVFSTGSEMFGAGFKSGDALVVNFHDDTMVGLSIYRIVVGESLKGEWVAAGADDIYAERLTKAPADHADHPPPASAPEKPKVKGDPKQEKQG